MKKNLLQMKAAVVVAVVLLLGYSCKKTELEVVAGFTIAVDAADFRKVTFTNVTQNASTYAWDFGDGASSTDPNPVHTYAIEGTYNVKLTATGNGGSDVVTQPVIIKDLNAELTKLAGTDNKVWKLLRIGGNGRYPLEVGPFDRTAIWWAMGLNNDEIANRPCSMNDEFTFYRDGRYKFDDKGDFWVEGNLFAKPDNVCATSNAANMKSPTGDDLSKWASGTHKFSIANNKLTVTGLGAFVGLSKLGTDVENKTPQPSVTYSIIKLTDGATDTMVLEGNYKFNAADANYGGYWKMVLVHYDDPSKEPAIPLPAPKAGFTYTNTGAAFTFTNTSTNATNYAWDFGDGSTATTKDATHTFANEGFYTVTMVASNNNGTATATTEVFFTSAVLTDALLQGNPWKVRAADNSVIVGPGLFDGSWYKVSKKSLDGSATGADDWSCMTDDQFTFKAGGAYDYKTNGTLRNDGYMGSPNGCVAESSLTGNAAAFGSNVHSYSFTPAAGGKNAMITLTNGAKGAAFLGFYKGYFGGENTDGTKAPNGGVATNSYHAKYAKGKTKEYLFVSVDVSAKKDGSSAWSIVLER